MWIRLTDLAWAASIIAVSVALWSGAGPWSAGLFSIAIACWAVALYRKQPEHSTVMDGDLRVLRANLDQVRALVMEASESASRDFEQINHDIKRQKALVMAICVDDVRHEDLITELEAVTRAIDKRIASLVVSMQFGDIVNQLLEFTDRQATEVETWLDSPGGGQHGQDAGRREKLALSDGRKPTSQTSMKAGELELF